MVANLFEFLFVMMIPTGVLIYTLSFSRWMGGKGLKVGSSSVMIMGICSYVATGWVVWNLLT